MKKFIIAISFIVLTLILLIPHVNNNKVETATHPHSEYIPYDIMYYNRTNTGMESGKLVFTYNHLEIHHGTRIEFFYFENTEYDEDEQIYTFSTTSNTTIIFDPSMATLFAGENIYYINSTIKSHW